MALAQAWVEEAWAARRWMEDGEDAEDAEDAEAKVETVEARRLAAMT